MVNLSGLFDKARRAVRDNPAPIIVGAIVVGLLATLLMSRR